MGESPSEVFHLCGLFGGGRHSWVAGVIWLLGNWRLIGWTLAVLAVLASAGVAIGKYNDRIRKPLQQEIRLLQDEKKALEDRSEQMKQERKAEIAKLKEQYDNDAKNRELSYQEKMSRLLASGSSGLRINQGCSGGAGGKAATDSAGSPDKAASGQGTLYEGREFTFGEVELSTMLGWYVYAESCHAFVNQK